MSRACLKPHAFPGPGRCPIAVGPWCKEGDCRSRGFMAWEDRQKSAGCLMLLGAQKTTDVCAACTRLRQFRKKIVDQFQQYKNDGAVVRSRFTICPGNVLEKGTWCQGLPSADDDKPVPPSCSCTCICITNHFFSSTDTAASASAILLQLHACMGCRRRAKCRRPQHSSS